MFHKHIFHIFIGHYLIGLQNNGELFVWFKDKDILKTIPGLEGIITLGDLRKGKHDLMLESLIIASRVKSSAKFLFKCIGHLSHSLIFCSQKYDFFLKLGNIQIEVCFEGREIRDPVHILCIFEIG